MTAKALEEMMSDIKITEWFSIEDVLKLFVSFCKGKKRKMAKLIGITGQDGRTWKVTHRGIHRSRADRVRPMSWN
jgi:hypothetical protein